MYESHGSELMFDIRVEGLLRDYLVKFYTQFFPDILSLRVEGLVTLV